MYRSLLFLLVAFALDSARPSTVRAATVSNTLAGSIVCDAKSPITDWKGTNLAVTGTVTWNGETKTMAADVWVDLEKWDSHNPLRDKHTRTMFEVEKFPRAHFTVAGVSGNTDAGEVMLRGTLDMHGVKREIQIPGKLQVANGRISFQGNIDVKITEYGMKRPSLLGAQVADLVKLTVQAQGKSQ